MSKPPIIAAAFLVIAGQSSVAASVEDNDPSHHHVARWGMEIHRALESGVVKEVEVRWYGRAKNPDRFVEGLKKQETQSAVRSILEPIFTAFENQDFEISNVHNLAEFHVSFAIQLPTVCISKSAKFVVTETMKGYFYIGCEESKSEDRKAGDLTRIYSPKLDRALREFFPREFQLGFDK